MQVRVSFGFGYAARTLLNVRMAPVLHSLHPSSSLLGLSIAPSPAHSSISDLSDGIFISLNASLRRLPAKAVYQR